MLVHRAQLNGRTICGQHGKISMSGIGVTCPDCIGATQAMPMPHTPGPWEVIAAPHLTSGLIIMGPLVNVAIVSRGGNAMKPEAQMQADANLIAAAPDILRELDNAMRLAADLEDLLKANGLDVSNEQASWDAQHRKFRAAIALAQKGR